MNFDKEVSPPTSIIQVVDPKTGQKTSYFFAWLSGIYNILKGTIGRGFTGTVAVAKLTGGGTNGSMTYVNGVVVSVLSPT